jgi:hypothetical protein
MKYDQVENIFICDKAIYNEKKGYFNNFLKNFTPKNSIIVFESLNLKN